MKKFFSRISSRCIAVLAIVLAAIPALGQDPYAKLEGVVKAGSKPVEGALAIATNSDSVWQIKTDEQGEFALLVPSGCYDVIVSSHYFRAKTRHLCVTSGEVKKLSFKVRIETGVSG